MSYSFNSTFLGMLKAGTWSGGPVVLYLYPQAPALTLTGAGGDGTSDAYMGIDHPSALQNTFGWGPPIRAAVKSATTGANGTLHYANLPDAFDVIDSMPDTLIRMFVFAVDHGNAGADQIMFMTDSLTKNGIILRGADGVIPAPNSAAANGLTLFLWYDVPAGAAAGVMPNAVEGKLLIDKGPPSTFDPARSQHLWVYPQRMNMIANPSFENDTNFWRSNGTLARINEAPPGGGLHSGRVTGFPKLILESNLFPLSYGRRREQGLTMQLKVRGDGVLKVGLLSWDNTYADTATNWGHDTFHDDALGKDVLGWRLSPTSFSYIRTMRHVGEVTNGMLRLETDGTFMDIDQVQVEPGMLPVNGEDWPYFDGDSYFGQKGDFSWYGGHQHASFSCWYNARLATFGRLFGRQISPEDQLPSGHFTNRDAAAFGMAYDWVPAGTPIQAHLDVLYPNDPVSPLPAVTGSPLPYSTPSTDGVASPW